jgi:hypothetical protein
VVGRAELGPERTVCLKLTLLNPDALPTDVDALLDRVVEAGLAAKPDPTAKPDPAVEPDQAVKPAAAVETNAAGRTDAGPAPEPR